MSNPSQAPKHALTGVQLSMSMVLSDCFLMKEVGDFLTTVEKEGKNLVFLQRILGRTALGNADSLIMPKMCTVDERTLMAVGPKLAITSSEGFQVRKRTQEGKAAAVLFALSAPLSAAEGWVWTTQLAMSERSAVTLFASGNPVHCLGRLVAALPILGARAAAPISVAEAAEALSRCGLRVGTKQMHRHELDGEYPITVNLKATNGLPVMGKFEGRAAELVVGLYKSLSEKFEVRYMRTPGDLVQKRDAVVDLLREMERDPATAPYVTMLGKCKSDMYSTEKVKKAMLRFYNAVPRQLMLLMQRATQALEDVAENILDAPLFRHSFSGVNLTRGGAGRLVEAMEAQLRERGWAYIHMGDDSWVVRAVGGRVQMFALDCSNFDLSQMGSVSQSVHEAIWLELTRADPVAAAVWYGLMRQRRVLVAGSMVKEFYDAGPSGMPLQSKVNDMLMDVMVTRAIGELGAYADVEEAVDSCLKRVGERMGFKVRVEQYCSLPVETMAQYLNIRPFLFVGYYFHVRDGRITVCCDIPRTIAQMPSPGLKWVKEKAQLVQLEAMRLGSILLSMGEVPWMLETSFAQLKRYVVELLERALLAGDLESEKLRWAVSQNPAGPEVIPSLSGLLAAVRRAPEIYSGDELPMVSASEGVPVPPELSRVHIRRVLDPRVRTDSCAAAHGPTRQNAGRPPSTTFWAPDRAPQLEMGGGGGGEGKRRPRKRGERDYVGFLNSSEDEWLEDAEEEFGSEDD